MVEKPCMDCGESKPLSGYYKHPRMSDEHLNSCKGCRKAYQQSRPYDKEYERKCNQTEKRKAYHAANLKRWRGDFTVEEFDAVPPQTTKKGRIREKNEEM